MTIKRIADDQAPEALPGQFAGGTVTKYRRPPHAREVAEPAVLSGEFRGCFPDEVGDLSLS
jgi:hypothetical protein